MSPYNITVGTVTIGGAVKSGTFYDPDLIAKSFWELYTKKNDIEVLYKQS